MGWPPSIRKRRIRVKIPQAAIAILSILVVVGMWGYWRSMKWELGRLRADMAETRTEITRNKQIVQLIEQYERDKKQLQERLALIQGLVHAQGGAARLLSARLRTWQEIPASQ